MNVEINLVKMIIFIVICNAIKIIILGHNQQLNHFFPLHFTEHF